TWNYIAVHLRGRLEKAEPEALPGMLDRLSAEFEARIADKPQWTRGKMPQDLQNRMFRQMMPCRLHIEEVTGIWKLNQNKPDEVRLRAADHVQDGALADVMRAASVPPKE
ncbi:MAG: FMN-binding negative transcriptional regulator, partial [Mangrovicoccus sp.]